MKKVNFFLVMFAINNAKIRNVKVGNKPHVLFDDGAENAEIAETIEEVVNKVTTNFKNAIMENIPKGAVISYSVAAASDVPAKGTRTRRTKEQIAADLAAKETATTNSEVPPAANVTPPANKPAGRK